MDQGDTIPSLFEAVGRPLSCAALTEPREIEEDNSPTPTHNAEQCEICQLHLQHLSIPSRSYYPDAPSYHSSVATQATDPEQSFEDGVKLGLRLQKESDDMLLNQYRKRLMRAEAQRDISRRAQYDLERLERELAEAKDMLLAVQISYEESVEAHTSAESELYNFSDSAVINPRTGNNVDSASQLTLDGADVVPGKGKDVATSHDTADAEAGLGSIYMPPDTAPADSKDNDDDDDDDFFMWEQLKALDEGDQEEFWKTVYNFENHSTLDHHSQDLDSTSNNNVQILADAGDIKSETRAIERRSPSPHHANDSTGKDDHHSDGEESSYSFI